MTKDEFTALLKARGLDAENDGGCVMVTNKDKNVWKDVSKLAKEIGFSGSYGWRENRNVANV